MIFFHGAVAMVSLILAVVTALSPSVIKLRVTYTLSFITVLTGLLLIISASASIAGTCIKGVFFLGLIATFTAIARKKLSLSLLY